jgi:hypothetical protein
MGEEVAASYKDRSNGANPKKTTWCFTKMELECCTAVKEVAGEPNVSSGGGKS